MSAHKPRNVLRKPDKTSDLKGHSSMLEYLPQANHVPKGVVLWANASVNHAWDGSSRVALIFHTPRSGCFTGSRRCGHSRRGQFWLSDCCSLVLYCFDVLYGHLWWWHSIVHSGLQIRNRSKVELQAFSRRWRRAAASDPEWMDPFKVELPSEENHYAVETKPDGRWFIFVLHILSARHESMIW